MTLAQITQCIANGQTFDGDGLAGDYIAVLSYSRIAAQLRSDQPMTRRVIADAKARRDRYMGTMEAGNRRALPNEAVYYVWDKATGTVLAFITADGSVTIATDFRTPRQMVAVSEGFELMRDNTEACRHHAGER